MLPCDALWPPRPRVFSARERVGVRVHHECAHARPSPSPLPRGEDAWERTHLLRDSSWVAGPSPRYGGAVFSGAVSKDAILARMPLNLMTLAAGDALRSEPCPRVQVRRGFCAKKTAMSELRVRIRRGRRTDFTAVMQLLAASGTPRCRRPSAPRCGASATWSTTWAADFYLALVDGALAGLVHVTYARQLAAAPAARLEQLVVAAARRRCGIGAALLRFAQQRARQRGCGTLSCAPPDGAPAAQFLEKGGLTARGALLPEACSRRTRDEQTCRHSTAS